MKITNYKKQFVCTYKLPLSLKNRTVASDKWSTVQFMKLASDKSLGTNNETGT